MKDSAWLKQAYDAVHGDERRDTDSPLVVHSRIARYWSVYLDKPIGPEDVAILMILLKIAREQSTSKPDNMVDVIGYTLCLEDIKLNV